MAEQSGGNAQPEPEVDEKISSEKYATRAGYWKVTGEGKPKNMQPEGRNRLVLQDIGNLVAKGAGREASSCKVRLSVQRAGANPRKQIQNDDSAEECLLTNYYGAKRMAEALIPLLQLSSSPSIVNVASSSGKLENIPNEWAKRVLGDAENLTKEKVDEVLKEFLKDFKEGSMEARKWPTFLSACTLSKAAMNAHTRILAKKCTNFCLNCVCPNFVKTNINVNAGVLPVEEGGANLVRLALIPDGSPSDLFYVHQELSSF